MLVQWRRDNGIGSFLTLSRLTKGPKVTDVQLRRMYLCECACDKYWVSVKRTLEEAGYRASAS